MKRDIERAELTPEPGPRGPTVDVPPPPVVPGGSTWRRVGLAVVLIAGVAVAVAGWSVQKSDHVISRSAVVRGDLSEMGTRFTGVLLSSDVQPGTRVKSGEVLGRLDDSRLRAQENEALAQVEALDREIANERDAVAQERIKGAARVQEVAARALAAQGAVRAARLGMEEAQAYQRVQQDLADGGIISVDALRQVKSRSSLAAEALAVAQSNGAAAQSALRTTQLEVSGLAVREQRVGVLEAQMKAARARLAQVRADIAASRITAPADGTVVRWLIHPGGSVDVGKPVLAFSVGDKRWVEAWIDEDEAARIRPGDTALVTMPFSPGRELQGTVTRVGVTTEGDPPNVGVLDPRPTKMRLAPVVPVEVTLRDTPASLLPGLSATVSIQTPTR